MDCARYNSSSVNTTFLNSVSVQFSSGGYFSLLWPCWELLAQSLFAGEHEVNRETVQTEMNSLKGLNVGKDHAYRLLIELFYQRQQMLADI